MSKTYRDRERFKKKDLERKKSQEFCDRHHMINQCKKDLYKNLQDPDNIHYGPRKKHELIHALFGNRDPHQIFERWLSLHRSLLSSEAKAHAESLARLGKEMYKEKFLKKSNPQEGR